MYSNYIVLIDRNVSLPSRTCLLEDAWGKAMPVSFVQSSEELNNASYLDVKVNKWEANRIWSVIQKGNEPWIRAEIFRDEGFEESVRKKKLQIPVDKENDFSVVLDLDDGWLDIDQILLARLVKILAKNQRCYAQNHSGAFVDCSRYLKSLPSKADVRKSIFSR